MQFNIFKVKLSNDNSSKTKSFFEDVIDNAMQNAIADPKTLGTKTNVFTKTPDDFPADVKQQLISKGLPCVLVQHSNGKYILPPLKNIGNRGEWLQKFFEIFNGSYEKKATDKLDIRIIYSNHFYAHAQSLMRAKIKQFMPNNIPYTIVEHESSSPTAAKILEKNTANKYNVFARMGNDGHAYQLAMYSEKDFYNSIGPPFDFEYKNFCEKASNAYNRIKNGEKIEDVVKKDAKKEKEEREKQNFPNPIQDLTDGFQKTLYIIGGCVCAYKALDTPSKEGEIVFGAMAAYLLFKGFEDTDKKGNKLGSPYQNAVRSAKKYACDKTYKQALDFNLNEMEKEVLRKAELKNRERYQKVLSHATKNCIKGIGSIRKSRFMEPYKQIGVPGLWSSITNIQFAIGKIGVYLIKKNNEFAYIGKGTNVYKTCLRHFEPHKNDGHNKQDYWQDVESQHYTVQIVVTTSLQEAEVLERALQFYYTPFDNINVPLEIEPHEKNALDKYLSVPSESF